MRIAFIHACLEPGRDGVGDYTAGLAAECVRQNVPACALALRDPFAPKEWEGDRSGVPTLRLPWSRSWGGGIEAVRRFLDRQNPDWVSLQFVPYAYDARGLVFGLARRLAPLFLGRRSHVMFHELWIGREPGDPLKARLIGWMQKWLVLRMARALRFEIVHTTNQYYVSQLQQAGLPVGEIPLFGAIPWLADPPIDWLYQRADGAGWPLTPQTRDQFLLFGLFGALHPVWPPEPLLGHLAEAGRLLGRKIGILSIGRQGPGSALWDKMAGENAGRFHFLRLGEQPEERVAGFFRFLDYGVAATPYALIGKSASAAAMLEHGLPVIVNRDEIPFAGGQTEIGESRRLLIRMRGDLPQILRKGVPRGRPVSRLPRVAAMFLRELASTAPRPKT